MKAQARRFYGYLKKDSMLLYKRKKYLYIFILLPLIIAGLFLFALNPSAYTITVGVCDFDKTELSTSAFNNLEGFTPQILADENCKENLESKIKLGKLDLGIIIEKGFSKNLQDLKQSHISVYYDNTDIAFANLVSWRVDSALNPFKREVIDSLNGELTSKASSIREGVNVVFVFPGLPGSMNRQLNDIDDDLEKIEELDTEFLTNPIWTSKVPVYDKDLKNDAGIVYIFPILAIFIILMLSSTSIIYDKKTNFMTRVKASASPISYLLAKTIFFTGLVLIQFIIILLLFMMGGAKYSLPIGPLINLILFIGIIDTLIGFIIGLIANNEGIAVLFSLMLSFPLMLVSGIFFPIQALPKIVQWISQILPLHYQINAAKSVLLFGQAISYTWIWWAIGLFAVVVYLIRKN